MKRLALGTLALALALGLAGTADAQVVCAKTNAKGKTKFKLRDACRSNEVVAQDFASLVPADVVTQDDLADVVRESDLSDVVREADLTDVVRRSELPAAPGDLATAADVADVPRTRAYAYDSGGHYTTVTPEGAPVLIDGTGTSVDVETTSASTDLVVTFHAECLGNESLLQVDVEVDGVAYGSTTAGGHGFCSAAIPATHGLTVVAPDLPPGVHTVTVEASVIQGTGYLDDAGVVILAVEN